MDKILAKTVGFSSDSSKVEVITNEVLKQSDFTDPKELIASAWAVCLLGSAKFVLKQKHLSNNIKSKVEVVTKLSKESKTIYFEVTGNLSIENMSLEETQVILDEAHLRCPVSKLIEANQYVQVKAELYD